MDCGHVRRDIERRPVIEIALPVSVRYTLRDEQIEDEPFLLELGRSSHDQDAAFVRCPDEQQLEFVAFERNLQNQTIAAIYPTAVARIILVGGERAGEVTVDRTPSSIRLIEIALAPRFRRRGIGTELVRSLCEEAAARRVPLHLRVAVTNSGARRLYQRLGFIETDADELFVDATWRAQ
jgi:ribosomal protein S18 acetylase RimI-like enzyme